MYMPHETTMQGAEKLTEEHLGLITVASFMPSDIDYPFNTPFNDSTKVIGFFGEAAKP